ncbi:MAG TPA: DoxX family protein, partial [Chitinophagales bacterium]|nr:DoxX family protein [Chitinophagales bacterium]
MTTIQQISLYIMAAFYAGGGINHFVNPKFYLGITPKFFPIPNVLNYVSGVAEIVLAIGLLFASTRQIS